MKKRNALLLFTLAVLQLQAQERRSPDSPFPTRSVQYSQGFEKIIAGQQLDYPPVLQKGKLALMVTPGGKPAEFQTAPMPAGNDERVTFVWQASLATGSGDRPANFDFFINGKKYFTFSSPRNAGEKDWMYQNESFELAFVATAPEDEKGNFLGYQFLTVPRRDFPAGQPLALKILAEDAKLPDAYTAYQNVVETALQVFAFQAIKRQEGKLQQPVFVEFTHTGAPASAAVFLDEKKQYDRLLQPGLNQFYIWVDKVAAARSATVEVVFDNKEKDRWKQAVALKPVRPFEVYLLPHSHVDIGFTHLQHEVEHLQWDNFEAGIELAKKTAGYPDGARYKWNVEVLWAVDGYLKHAPPESRNAFIDAVKKGWIGLDALYGSELTGLQRPEELMHVTGFANQMERDYGIQINSAMISDVPGYAWGIVPALAENEVKYFSIGPNHMPHKAHGGYQVGLTFEAWGDVPFYWESPSGKGKVLFWMTRHGYSWFHDWLLGKLRRTQGTPILKFLGELDSENYPYDMVQIRYTLGDNSGPDADTPEFVKEWNETYEYPKFRIATTSEMFMAFEQKYGEKLPVHRGDFTPYWEDGAASSALETGTNRNTAEQLVQAEMLWTMLDPNHFPSAEFDEAWTNVLLFSEHTWGAVSSKSDPDIDFSTSQWNVKKGFADNAERQSKVLIYKILSNLKSPGEAVSAFLVFNTTSWERTELVKIPAAWKAAGLTVFGADGQALPAQMLSTGEMAFVAKNIPPFSAARFTLKKKAAKKSKAVGARADGLTLTNEWLTVKMDPATGAIASIRQKDLAFDLVDTADTYGFNEYWYTGVDAANPRRSEKPVIRIKENGPLVASFTVASEAPGANLFTREIQLTAGMNRVDILNLVDKKRVYEDENVRFSFPFNVPDGQLRIDLAWALMEPEKDQLRGANKNFFCAQHFVDISNSSDGVTWANLDAPLVETGGMHGQHWMSDPATEPWFKTWTPSNRLFSWVMNNVWFVNYKGHQEGPVPFRYALRPHKAFDSSDAKKFGIGLVQPLILAPVGETQTGLNTLLNLEGDPAVIVTALKPARDGNGYLLRLFNTSEKPATTTLTWGDRKAPVLFSSNAKEKFFEKTAGTLQLDGWEIRTLRVVFE
jgi:alpha-mannosidase